MCWRADSSGTTPPHSRWRSTCEATTLERTRQGRSASPVSSTTAAAVSSQEVSIPRTIMEGLWAIGHGLWVERSLRRGTEGRALSCLQSRERLFVWRAGDAVLGHDGGDIAR